MSDSSSEERRKKKERQALEDEEEDAPPIYTVGGRYALADKLGEGSFGAVYLGRHVETYQTVAIKLEKLGAPFPQLAGEYKIYRLLAGGTGIPKVYWYGVEGDFNVMVMDCLGPSLEDLHDMCGKKFSFKTMVLIGTQLVERLEYCHKKHFLHRDVKPDNFLIGATKQSARIVYLIDLGLSMVFRDKRTKRVKRYEEDLALIGTARYASIYAHLGISLARRDDLESVMYMLVYFVKGKLPWMGIRANTPEQKYEKIMETKARLSLKKLCRKMPPEVLEIFRHVRTLRYEDCPDYKYIYQLFNNIMLTNNLSKDFKFDWKSPELYEQFERMLRIK